MTVARDAVADTKCRVTTVSSFYLSTSRGDDVGLEGIDLRPAIPVAVVKQSGDLEAWQAMNTAPKDRHILVKWQTSVVEAVWLKHRNAFCILSECYGSPYTPLECDWLDGWQESTLAKIEALDLIAQ